MRTFFLESLPEPGEEGVLDANESRHALRVLRLAKGDSFAIVDGKGARAVAQLTGLAGRQRAPEAAFVVLNVSVDDPPTCAVTLFLAPPRAKHMTECIRFCTELGIASIVPTICDYSVARPENGALRHWRAEAVAAAKQSGNSFLPQIGAPVDFAAAAAGAGEIGIFGDVGETREASVSGPTVERLAIWIGPEGGFSPDERTALLETGMIPVKLGRWVLRVETAVPALVGWLYGKRILL